MTLFATVQITSQDHISTNLEKLTHWVREAAHAGAQVVALPETCLYIGPKDQTDYKMTLQSPVLQALKNLSQELGVFLHNGSVHQTIVNEERVFNCSYVFSPEGEVVAQYHKVHLCDINTPDATLKESEHFKAGDPTQLPLLQTPYGQWGLSICYDLRFPEFYRKLVQAGAEVIFVPSAFTNETGKDHWEVLLRARAIENQAYIVAANQFGRHSKKRKSYGNSMIIDPWGKVLARASDKEGFILADIDLDYLQQVRQQLPALTHRRL